MFPLVLFYPVNFHQYLLTKLFIFSSNPKKRFELFYKATQLDVIIEKLDQATHQFSVAKTKFFAQRRLHANNVEEQKKAHEKLNQFQSMEPLKVSTSICIHAELLKKISFPFVM